MERVIEWSGEILSKLADKTCDAMFWLYQHGVFGYVLAFCAGAIIAMLVVFLCNGDAMCTWLDDKGNTVVLTFRLYKYTIEKDAEDLEGE